MKFGGTSVGSAEQILGITDIVSRINSDDQVVVIVSAMSRVTDLLVSTAIHASQKNRAGAEQGFVQIKEIHLKAITGLSVSDAADAQLRKTINEILFELKNLLDSITVLGELTPRALDLIVSFGERLCIQVVSSAFSSAGVAASPVEATQLIVTNDQFGDARPLLDKSEPKAKQIIQKLLNKKIVPVITGFIGATQDGITTTLGRGGSDYSATILGNCLDADEVWIYTDVDGAMTAHPRIIPNAKTIPELSYNEAAEMSYFGAKVLHPLTMMPASLKKIPIRVKNTFNPDRQAQNITQ